MAYAILPALMLCMHRFFNKINNIQILRKRLVFG